MQIEKVNCLVSLNNGGQDAVVSQIVKSGPSAISVTEIPLIQMQNGPDSVTRVHSAGFFETSKREELSRLAEIYPSKVLDVVYPGMTAPLPKTIAEADVPDKHLHDAPVAAVEEVEDAEVIDTSKDDEIATLRKQLAAALSTKAEAMKEQLAEGNSTLQGTSALCEGTVPETKEEWRAALKAAGVIIPIGNHGIPALKAMMPVGD